MGHRTPEDQRHGEETFPRTKKNELVSAAITNESCFHVGKKTKQRRSSTTSTKTAMLTMMDDNNLSTSTGTPITDTFKCKKIIGRRSVAKGEHKYNHW